MIRQCDDVRVQVEGGVPSCELVLKCTSQRQPILRRTHTLPFTPCVRPMLHTEKLCKLEFLCHSKSLSLPLKSFFSEESSHLFVVAILYSGWESPSVIVGVVLRHQRAGCLSGDDVTGS